LEIPLQQQQQQMMGQMTYNNTDNDKLTSHQLANEIRELYDLPIINKQDRLEEGRREHLLLSSSVDIITNLNGFFKEYAADFEENAIDVIKECRENIS
jgi:hypothetical protein